MKNLTRIEITEKELKKIIEVITGVEETCKRFIDTWYPEGFVGAGYEDYIFFKQINNKLKKGLERDDKNEN